MANGCRNTFFWLGFIFLNIASRNLSAQTYDYNDLQFKHFVALQGLPSGNCYKLYKDDYGFLWISNYYGVSIFSGSKFINLPLYSSQKNYFLGSCPHSFLQLNKDSLLIGCTDGLYMFNYHSNDANKIKGQPVVPSGAKVQVIGFDNVHDKIMVKIGSIIYFFDRAMRQTGKIFCEDENPDVAVYNQNTNPFHYYFTHSLLLVGINIETNKKDTIAFLPEAAKGLIINGQMQQTCVIATASHVLTIDFNSKKITNKISLPVQSVGQEFSPLCMKMDDFGNFWIGGRTNLFIYKPKENIVTTAKLSSKDFINDKTVLVSDILIDHNDVFISSLNDGLFQYDTKSAIFKDYFLADAFSNSVYSSLVDANNLYCASDGEVVKSFNVNQPADAHKNFPLESQYGGILGIEKMDDKHFWITFRGDYHLGIISNENFRLLKNAGIPSYIDSLAAAHSRSALKFPRVDAQPLIKNAGKDLSYYSIKNYLYAVKGNAEEGIKFSLVDSVQPSSYISCICLSPSKELIIGTTNLEMYELQGSKLVKKTISQEILNLPIKSICVDEEEKKYVLTINGLYVYDKDYHLLRHLTHSNTKMISDILFAGMFDKNDVLWMSSTVGIMCYDTRSDRFYNFSANLFHNREFNTRSVTIDNNNNIYFGGSNGITAIEANKFSGHGSESKLYFSEIKNSDSILYNGIMPGSFGQVQNFGYDKNNLRFSISSISYHQADDVQYKYFLEGFDSTWGMPDKSNMVSYTNLPPGKYKFRAKETYGGINDPGSEISYSFFIEKPFWKTAGFIVFMLVSAACLVGFVVKYFMDKKLEKQRLQVSKQLALRTERERISQELHDDLGSGLTSIRLLSKSVISKYQHGGDIAGMLDNIGKISGELIDQMSEIVWLMNHMDDTINGLFAHLRIYMADYLYRTGVPLRLHFENTIQEDYSISGAQRRNILLVVKESFHNVVKHSNAKDFSVHCSSNGDFVQITISDNGVGLPQEITLNGNGINNIKKRIQSVNGNIRFESTNGTKIIIDLPKEI